MNLNLIAENMRGNIQKIDRLQRQIKEDIRDAHQKKQYYNHQIREYKKLHDSNIAMAGGLFVLVTT